MTGAPTSVLGSKSSAFFGNPAASTRATVAFSAAPVCHSRTLLPLTPKYTSKMHAPKRNQTFFTTPFLPSRLVVRGRTNACSSTARRLPMTSLNHNPRKTITWQRGWKKQSCGATGVGTNRMPMARPRPSFDSQNAPAVCTIAQRTTAAGVSSSALAGSDSDTGKPACAGVPSSSNNTPPTGPKRNSIPGTLRVRSGLVGDWGYVEPRRGSIGRGLCRGQDGLGRGCRR